MRDSLSASTVSISGDGGDEIEAYLARPDGFFATDRPLIPLCTFQRPKSARFGALKGAKRGG